MDNNRIIVLTLALFAAVGCGVCKKQQPTVVVRDSIRVEYRDRIVRDTINYEIPVEVEKIVTRDTVSHLEMQWCLVAFFTTPYRPRRRQSTYPWRRM